MRSSNVSEFELLVSKSVEEAVIQAGSNVTDVDCHLECVMEAWRLARDGGLVEYLDKVLPAYFEQRSGHLAEVDASSFVELLDKTEDFVEDDCV